MGGRQLKIAQINEMNQNSIFRTVNGNSSVSCFDGCSTNAINAISHLTSKNLGQSKPRANPLIIMCSIAKLDATF